MLKSYWFRVTKVCLLLTICSQLPLWFACYYSAGSEESLSVCICWNQNLWTVNYNSSEGMQRQSEEQGKVLICALLLCCCHFHYCNIWFWNKHLDSFCMCILNAHTFFVFCVCVEFVLLTLIPTPHPISVSLSWSHWSKQKLRYSKFNIGISQLSSCFCYLKGCSKIVNTLLQCKHVGEN